MNPLRLALVFSLFAVSVASAQSASERGVDFSAFTTGRTIVVIDDAGHKTTGRLSRFTPDTLIVAVKDKEVTASRQNTSVVYERRNSVKRGAIIGGIIGAFLLVNFTGGNPPPQAADGLLILSGLSVGTGILIDAMIPEKRIIYEKPGGRRGLSGSVSW